MIGNLTKIEYSTTSGGSYTKLAHLTDITLPKRSIGKVETTEYESPSNTKEFDSEIWIDPGDVSGEINYVTASAAAVEAQLGVKQFWKITAKDGAIWAFPGFLSELGPELPNKDKSTQKFTIAVTGAIVFTPGT